MLRHILISSVCLSWLLGLPACVLEADDGRLIDDAEQPIVNGFEDSGSIYQHVVQVLIPNSIGPCTGTVIGNRTVLTAGHCVTGPNGVYPQQTVRIWQRICDGEGFCGEEPFDFVGTPVRHPSYQPGGTALGRNDIAVIRLNANVPSFVGRGRINTAAVQAGQHIKLVGYGRTSASGPYPPWRRYGSNNIDVVNPATTNGDQYYFFAGAAGADAGVCYGDSGGPHFGGSFASTCVVGITRGQFSGPICADGGTFVGTRVDLFSGWILGAAQEPIGTCTP